jgi:uncharacterized integral membrane protein (TIGR00698 family)
MTSTHSPSDASLAARAPGLAQRLLNRIRVVAPGLTVALLVAAAATPLGRAVPLIGGPVFGIVLGIVLAAAIHPGDNLRPGLAFASSTVLKSSIVLLGATLSLAQILTVGAGSLPVMLGTLAIALGGAFVLGRLLGVRGDTRTLIGVGTAICGASAIAAATAVLKPKDTEVAYALGTIFTFNVVAVLTFPATGHLLGMGPQAFGLWAGTAINDTSSVVAASYSFSADAGSDGLVVKLTRTLTLIPIVITLASLKARGDARAAASAPGRSAAGAGPGWRALPWSKMVPLFLIGFIAAAALATAGVIPTGWQPPLSVTGTFLITVALAGIGLSLRVHDIRAAGPRPLLLGALLWVLVAVSSLGLQAATGTLW